MDIMKMCAALTEHLNTPETNGLKMRVETGVEILNGLNMRKGPQAGMMLNKYTMAGLVRLVTQRHRLGTPIRQYATDLHEFWVDALGVKPDGTFKPVELSTIPNYDSGTADPEAEAVAAMTQVFREKY